MNLEPSILALIARLQTAKVKAQFDKTAAWKSVQKIICSYVELRGRSTSESGNIFDVLELALLTEDEPFAETLRQVLIALGNKENATRVMAMIWRERGNGLRENEKYEEAIYCYRKAIEIYPNFANALNELALSLEAIDQVEEAITNYKKAIHLCPDCALYRYHLACSLLGSNDGRNEDGIQQLEAAIAIDPSNWNYQALLGGTYKRGQNLSLAREHYLNALQLSSDQEDKAFIYSKLGEICTSQCNWEDAEYNYENAILNDPNDLRFYIELAQSTIAQKKVEKTILVLEKGIEIAALCGIDSSSNLFVLFMMLGKIHLGRKDILKAVISFCGADEVKSNLAKELNSSSETVKEMEDTFREQKARVYGGLVSTFLEGRDLCNEKNFSQGLSKLREVVKICPHFAEAHLTLANQLVLSFGTSGEKLTAGDSRTKEIFESYNQAKRLFTERGEDEKVKEIDDLVQMSDLEELIKSCEDAIRLQESVRDGKLKFFDAGNGNVSWKWFD